MGPNQLSRIQRNHSAGRRMGIERHWSEELLLALYHHLYGRKLPLRYRADTSDLASCTRATRRRRRWPPTDGAGHHGGFLRASKAWTCILALRTGRGACSVPWPDDRRLDHRQLLLALDFL